MAFEKLILLYLCAVSGITQAAYVDTLNKCSATDQECLKSVMVQKIRNPGVPELNILTFDPIDLKSFSIFSVLNSQNLTLTEGVMTGFKDCVFNSFNMNATTGMGKEQISLDLNLKGDYNADALVDNEDLNGEGNGDINIEKLILNISFPFHFEKRGDNIFTIVSYDQVVHSIVGVGKLEFIADEIMAGETNIASTIESYVNDADWVLLLKEFVDELVTIYLVNSKSFFENVATKYYITDDLTDYVQN